jgi:release factor glutamine methyltransferase
MNLNPFYQNCLERILRNLTILADKPEETPQNTLHSLWHAAAGNFYSAEAALDHALETLSASQEDALETLVEKRLSGIPLAHLTGRQRFLGIDFIVGPEALAPRKETELLGKTVLDLVGVRIREQGSATVLDVCTGIGNIAIAVAHFFPHASVFASDISVDAIRLARQNCTRLGLDGRINLRTGDLFEPFGDGSLFGKVDVISCNPPYISTGKLKTLSPEIIQHEPLLAFDGGPFGVRILSRVFKESQIFLRAKAHLCFEVGSGQANGIIQLLNRSGQFSLVTGATDAQNEIRVVIAQR